jgi:hypothetical protein
MIFWKKRAHYTTEAPGQAATELPATWQGYLAGTSQSASRDDSGFSVVHFEFPATWPHRGGVVTPRSTPIVTEVDFLRFGQPARLVWHDVPP